MHHLRGQVAFLVCLFLQWHSYHCNEVDQPSEVSSDPMIYNGTSGRKNTYLMELDQDPFDANNRKLLNERRKAGIDCDLDIICANDQVVKCHKNVLRLHCDQRNWTLSDKKKLMLKHLPSEIVTAVIEYFYLGKLEVTPDNILGSLEVCDKLQATETTRKLAKYLLSIIPQFGDSDLAQISIDQMTAFVKSFEDGGDILTRDQILIRWLRCARFEHNPFYKLIIALIGRDLKPPENLNLVHFTLHGRLFEFDTEDLSQVKIVSEFDDSLDEVNLIIDRERGIRIGINSDGNAKVYNWNKVVEVLDKKVWGYVNAERDSVLLLTDGTIVSYSDGFTYDIDPKFKLLEKVKCDARFCRKLMEFRIVSQYFVAGRNHDTRVFVATLRRATQADMLEWYNQFPAIHFNATSNPFVVAKLYVSDGGVNNVTFVRNGHFVLEVSQAISMFPLPTDSVISVANFYSNDTKMLVAVDLPGDKFEFRLYDLLDFTSVNIVSEKITKK